MGLVRKQTRRIGRDGWGTRRVAVGAMERPMDLEGGKPDIKKQPIVWQDGKFYKTNSGGNLVQITNHESVKRLKEKFGV